MAGMCPSAAQPPRPAPMMPTPIFAMWFSSCAVTVRLRPPVTALWLLQWWDACDALRHRRLLTIEPRAGGGSGQESTSKCPGIPEGTVAAATAEELRTEAASDTPGCRE